MKTREIEDTVFPGDHVSVTLSSGKTIEGFVGDVEFSDDFDGASDCIELESEKASYSIGFEDIESLLKA